MATTLAWLQAKDSARVALTLAFDGYDYLATTADTPSQIATAWAATDWTSAKGGLSIVGATKQQIELFDPRINPDSLTFTIADTDDTLRASLLSPLSPTYKTYCVSSVTAGQTTAISVIDTTGFPSLGHIYCGHEAIQYTTTTGTTFAGTITRGKWSIFGVSGGTRIGASHRLQPNTSTNEATAPAVTSSPRVWYNRRVALYAHHWEAGAWSTKANARLVWSGRIKSYRDNGDGSISLECRSLMELFEQSVFSDQLRGKLAEGVYLREEDTKVMLSRINPGEVGNYGVSATFATSEAVATWRDVIVSINAAMDSVRTTSNPDSVTFYETTDPGTNETRVGAQWAGSSLLSGSGVWLALSPRVWDILGFIEANQGTFLWGRDASGYELASKHMWFANGNTREIAIGVVPPRRSSTIYGGGTLSVTNVTGTWASQSGYMPTSIMSGGNGFLRIGDVIQPVAYDTGANTFTLAGSPVLGTTGEGIDIGTVFEGDDLDLPDVKQVWFEEDKAGTLLLRLIESTGVADYNNSTYDKYPLGVGLSVPDGLINVPSFEAVDDDLPAYELFLEEPTPFPKILETICAVTGRYPVMKNGAVTLTKAPAGAPGLASAYSLTESNKARIDDRPRVEYSTDGLVNRATLEYQRGQAGKLENEFTVEDVVSIGDFGASKGATIKGRGLHDYSRWVSDVAAPSLAYFSRPLAHLSRTYDFSLIDMAPADPVLVTDDYVVDPRAGTRGISLLPMWLVRTSFDWRTGIGTAECVFNAETDARRIGPWAPSAKVSSYVAATAAITTTTNSFSDSATEAVDASHFAAGDKVRIVEVSPAASASPSTFVGTVSTVSSNVITLTADGTAGGGLDAAKRYVVEFDDVATVQTAQQAKVFIADDANNSTGLAANDAFRWWSDPSADMLSVAAITYSNEFIRPYDLQDDTGEPGSVHKLWYLVDSLNNLLGYKTSNILINDYLPAIITNAAAATEKLCYGPVKVPIYGHRSRTLKFRAYAWTSNAADPVYIKVYSSMVPPTGTAFTTLVFPDNGATSATRYRGSASAGWTTEQTIAPRVAGFGPAYTWITVVCYTASGATASFRGISLAESNL